MEQLRAADPAFSLILLEDFLYALYAEVHAARGRGEIARYSAFLTAEAAASLPRGALADVRDIVIGAMSFVGAWGMRGDRTEVCIRVRFESNYTEVAADGAARSYYAAERWTLFRKRDARSRSPDKARVFTCPSCGAPLEVITAGVCGHCGKLASSGEFDWVVREIALEERTPRGPMLTAETREEGTSLPTVVDPEAAGRLEELVARDPAFTWESFEGRVALVFTEFQTAWAARDVTGMRPFFTDRLFEAQRYWVEAYRKQGLRNVTENAAIQGLVAARVTSDAFFDAITVRLRAESLDYTVDEKGKLVCGSRSRPRAYSEYWTLIRTTSRRGPTRTDRVCPNCGAPLDVNMAGTCKYCQAKVTAGDFDWVLSRIEQDEVYEG
jgi:predicted lipid-binding transport protein (Tim44 family)